MRRRLLGLLLLLACAAAVAAPGGTSDPEVTMPGKLFAPGELDVLVGQRVSWRNADVSSHTVTADDDSFDSGYLSPGSTFSRTFAQTGVFAYHCTIHRFMKGVVRAYALILTGSPGALPPGWSVTLRGVAPRAGSTVVLERLGGRDATPVAQAVAAEDGSFSFGIRPSGPVGYRARSGDAASPPVRVAVKPNVAIQLSEARVLVSTAPRRPMSRVELQAYDRERFAWVTIAKARLGSDSRAQLPLAVAAPAHLRIVVRGRDGWSDGMSRTVVIPARR